MERTSKWWQSTALGQWVSGTSARSVEKHEAKHSPAEQDKELRSLMEATEKLLGEQSSSSASSSQTTQHAAAAVAAQSQAVPGAGVSPAGGAGSAAGSGSAGGARVKS